MNKKLRIAINAQIPRSSGTGGIETVLRVLTSLAKLPGDEEYVFIGHWADSDWLKPLLGARQTIVPAPRPAHFQNTNRLENIKRLTGVLRPLARRVKSLFAAPKVRADVPVSDGFYESLNCDVIHFPYQDFVRSDVPSIYNPHDLQHLHFPEFFSAEEIARRETLYPAACRASRIIVAASEFIKLDIIEKYKIESDKVQVIPWSPPEITLNDFSETEAAVLLEKYECPPRPFALYPAMTWEHKNHLRLLEAVALLRDRDDLKINLVCTGHQNSFYPQIERRVEKLKLGSQIRFTGIVEYEELSVFYRLAQFVIVPTLFEAASAPLFEAWQHNVAVACSSVTSLPEQAAGAALLFDPLSVEAMAAALKKMSLDENLRVELRGRGRERLKDFAMERTARAYRAVYRKAAGLILDQADKDLLNRNWGSENS